jgi:hypothetical protein
VKKVPGDDVIHFFLVEMTDLICMTASDAEEEDREV